jgi:hypothetical protein
VLAAAPRASSTPPAPKPAFSITQARDALIEGRSGHRESATSLGIDLAGFNWFQEIAIAQRAVTPQQVVTVFLLSRHLSGEIFAFGPDGRLASRLAIGEPVTYQPIDLDGDGLMELMVEEVDGYGTGIYETGYHIYGALAERVKQVWTAPALWSWSNRDPEQGRGLLRFEWRWGHPGPLVLYFADGVRDGKTVKRREAWEYVNGKFKRTTFPGKPGV